MTYSDDQNDQIYFMQQPSNAAGVVDTEDCIVEEIMVNQYAAQLIQKEGEDDQIVILIWGDDNITFTLQGADQNVLEKMARSIHIKK